jgi:Tol biopolymer transport system component
MIPIDPVTARAGTPLLMDSSNNIRVPSDVSPDGKLIAYFNIGEQQEDLLVGPPDGPMRRLTDDAPRNRAAAFTRDGASLLFQSTRDGNWATWSIGVDGGNLRKIADSQTAGLIYPVVSPNGEMVAVTAGRKAYVQSLAVTTDGPRLLPGTSVGETSLVLTSWSADGARIAGIMTLPSGQFAGVGVYDYAAQKLTVLSSDSTPWVRWLADGRRLVYFASGGSELVVLDTITRARTVVSVRLPASSTDEMFALSPDNRAIYYGAARAETDIWIVERK